PDAMFSLVDPDFQKARCCDVTMSIAESVYFAHLCGELFVVVSQLGEHVLRRHIIRVVIEKAFDTRNMTNGPDGGSTDLPRAFRDGIGGVVYLGRLLIEQEMVVAKMRSGHMP